MNIFKKLYNRFITHLANAIALAQYELAAKNEYIKQNKELLNRARAIAALENPEKVNDFNYLKDYIAEHNRKYLKEIN